MRIARRRFVFWMMKPLKSFRKTGFKSEGLMKGIPSGK